MQRVWTNIRAMCARANPGMRARCVNVREMSALNGNRAEMGPSAWISLMITGKSSNSQYKCPE